MQLSVEQARKLVCEQFPHWAHLPIRRLRSFGTDHLLFRLGADKLARFPVKSELAQFITFQEQWMARFENLPLETPQILGTGRANKDFPYTWTITSWIDGNDATSATIDNWPEAAETLGKFVRQLRMTETAGGISSGDHNSWRGCSLTILDDRTRAAIDRVADCYEKPALISLWDEALAAPMWEGPPKWIHGDLHAANLVIRDGQVAGVIDFGLMAVGDPACDLALAWSFLPAQHREQFLQVADANKAMQQRGKGWALYTGVIALSFYRDKNPVLASIAKQAVEAVLAFN